MHFLQYWRSHQKLLSFFFPRLPLLRLNMAFMDIGNIIAYWDTLHYFPNKAVLSGPHRTQGLYRFPRVVTETYCVTQRFWVLFMINWLIVFRWLQFCAILKILCHKLACHLIWQFSQFRLKKKKKTKQTNQKATNLLPVSCR